jgi:hypothetical protein
LLLLGFLSTLDAAVAAFLLVISLLLRRFFILRFLRLGDLTICSNAYTKYSGIEKRSIYFLYSF